MKDKPDKIAGLELDLPVAKLHISHGTGFAPPDGTKLGEYTVHYADKTTEAIPIVYGEDVRDWWDADGHKKVTRGKEAWRGKNQATEKSEFELRLYLTSWENPHPEKDITKIDYSSTKTSNGAPFCIAITAELKCFVSRLDGDGNGIIHRRGAEDAERKPEVRTDKEMPRAKTRRRQASLRNTDLKIPK